MSSKATFLVFGPSYDCAITSEAALKNAGYMMTSSNKNIFRVTGLLCGEFTGHRWISRIAQRPVTWSFDVFFDLRLDQQLNKQTSVIWDAIVLIMTSL